MEGDQHEYGSAVKFHLNDVGDPKRLARVYRLESSLTPGRHEYVSVR